MRRVKLQFLERLDMDKTKKVIEQPYMRELWFAVLCDEVARSSRTVVAKQLNVSVPTISLIMNGKYGGKPDAIRQKVLLRFTQVRCPHTQQTVILLDCQTIAFGQAPTHNPVKMAHWRACQSCPHKPRKATSCDKKDVMHA